MSHGVLVASCLVLLVGSAAGGETIDGVWSKSSGRRCCAPSAHGLTLAVHRGISGPFAFVTSWQAHHHGEAPFDLVCDLTAIPGIIATVWMPQLPRASELERPALLITGQPTAGAGPA